MRSVTPQRETPTLSPISQPAVLLIAHGTPERIEDIPEFLRNIAGGHAMPEAVVREVQQRYSLIGRSPLLDWTRKQATSLQEALSVPVYIGMRNWKPLIADAIHHIVTDRITHTVAICLAPQNSRTSVGLYRRALAGEEAAPLPFAVEFIESWHDHPFLIRGFAERLRAGWKSACSELGAKAPIIFTAHSVPTRTIAEGDPYEAQARETAALVAKEAQLNDGDWTFAFQSQGMSGGSWLGPTVEDTIAGLQTRGHAGVFLQPIGFLCDHVEVLYDVDIAFQKFARDRGMRLWRAESLNGSSSLTAALADLARRRFAAAGVKSA